MELCSAATLTACTFWGESARQGEGTGRRGGRAGVWGALVVQLPVLPGVASADLPPCCTPLCTSQVAPGPLSATRLSKAPAAAAAERPLPTAPIRGELAGDTAAAPPLSVNARSTASGRVASLMRPLRLSSAQLVLQSKKCMVGVGKGLVGAGGRMGRLGSQHPPPLRPSTQTFPRAARTPYTATAPT